MRGSPLLQALCLAVALALAGLPVWLLTRPHVHAVAPPTAPTPTAQRMVELAVTSTSPARVTLSLEGKVVWQSPSGTNLTAPLDLPAAGCELVVEVRWTGDQTQAVRLEFSHDGERLTDTTLWGGAETTDVITLPALP